MAGWWPVEVGFDSCEFKLRDRLRGAALVASEPRLQVFKECYFLFEGTYMLLLGETLSNLSQAIQQVYAPSSRCVSALCVRKDLWLDPCEPEVLWAT